jgi:hypothetical protein
MAIDRGVLEGLRREELVIEARRFGVKRPEVMTRVELVDEIVRLGTPNPLERKKARGWLGVARDLIASAVEQGLNLPDAAALIRGEIRFEPLRTPHRPVATVTLAEIYGAQGHFGRALGILDEVLAKEPEHGIARTLRDRLARERDEKKGDAPRVPPDPPEEPDDTPDADTLPPPPLDAVTLPPPPSHASLLSAPLLFDDPNPPGEPPDARTLMPPPRTDGQSASLTLPTSNGAIRTSSDDALVLVRADASLLVAYYECGPRRSDHDGSVVVRVVEMRPGPSGAERVERDLPVDGASGTIAIDGIEASSVVRAALGTKRNGEFCALAVGAEVRVGESGPEIIWSPRRGATSLAVIDNAMARLKGETLKSSA